MIDLLGRIGAKSGAAVYDSDNVSGALPYLKALIDAGIAVKGAVNDGAPGAWTFVTNLTEATEDHYKGMLVMFITGALTGQAKTINTYTGASKTINCITDAFTEAPANADQFVILPTNGSFLQYMISSFLAPTHKGTMQMGATTIDLNQAAASYTLFTGSAQVVIVEKLLIAMPVGAAGGALTSISIQTNDATPQVFITAAQGLVANLTSENQLAWTGAIRIGVGKLIQLTIGGGATGAGYVCNVNVEYRSVTSLGTLV